MGVYRVFVMSEKLTEQQVRRVAQLARLTLTDDEVHTFTRQLDRILEFVAQLNELDTAHVEPLAHCLPVQNALRADEIKDSLSNAAALQNAPQPDGEFFAIPKVLGDASS